MSSSKKLSQLPTVYKLNSHVLGKSFAGAERAFATATLGKNSPQFMWKNSKKRWEKAEKWKTDTTNFF